MAVAIKWGTVQRPADQRPFVRFSVHDNSDEHSGAISGKIDVDIDGDIDVKQWAQQRLARLLQETLSEIGHPEEAPKMAILSGEHITVSGILK